jgi:endonuclease YncB( thermonuclease family)
MMRFILVSLFLCLAAAGVGAEQQGASTAGTASVIDGDTIEIHGERIRIEGIDAPESDQRCTRDGKAWPCGRHSALALDALLQGTTTACSFSGKDKYGRWLGACRSEGTDIGQWMTEQGWAVAYRKYSQAYVTQEENARRQKVNIWSGTFDMPEEWRARKRGGTTAQAKVPRQGTACNIKGNISRNGRIYHVPGGAWYDRTQIDTSRGERWFCSEKEAIAAGWRGSRG